MKNTYVPSVAGVGDLMTRVAGEVCDGFLCHGFSTERYLREVTVPALAEGRRLAGKTMEGFDINAPGFGARRRALARAARGA